jgi:Mrp family chromosome partitioning ATPase
MNRDLRADGSPFFTEETATVLPSPHDPVTAALLHGRTVAAEELRLLVAKLQRINEARPARCIGVLSATGGEGKTTLAIGLAAALAAEPDRRVLLLEMDLRKPAIEGYLGLSPQPGVGEWLRGVSPGPMRLRWVAPPGFALLVAGRAGLERPALLGTRRMSALFEAARQAFDFVIVDCPPITPVSDAALIQDLLDGFLFLVRARHSPRDVVMNAASRLKGDRILGTVFNELRDAPSYYYGYGVSETSAPEP